eukprot:3684124-Rhodomonas_salina.5
MRFLVFDSTVPLSARSAGMDRSPRPRFSSVKGGKLPGEVAIKGVWTAVCSGFGQTVSHLDLQGCKIEGKGCGSLALALRQCRNVSHLNLYGNKIGDLGATRLASRHFRAALCCSTWAITGFPVQGCRICTSTWWSASS